MDKLAAVKSKNDFIKLANKILTEDLSDLDDEEAPSTSAAKPKKRGKATNKKKETDENEAPIKKARRTKRGNCKRKVKQEKEINKIGREVNAAKNSKCEQYLYCYCSRKILQMHPQLENNFKKLFTERKLENQIVFEDMEVEKIYWKKKLVSAVLEDEMVKRIEEFVLQFGFVIAIDGEMFKSLVQTKQCEELVANSIVTHAADIEDTAHMTLAVVGAHGVSDSKINTLSLRLFETHRVQLRFCRDSVDLVYLVAQVHRSLAKMEKKLEQSCGALHVEVEKGIRYGDNLVEDWWSRMLNHMYRLPEECRRAILDLYPNPFELMDKLDRMQAGDAMQHLADIQCTNNRRVGPKIAQKLYHLLTNEDGAEVIDRPS
ncbi:hypothetical protein M3Y98_00480800 [Aphelenchoides besseyi]|nr:hypothetical protein M3Y98_00480800 [Aphelenchoides besseyi]